MRFGILRPVNSRRRSWYSFALFLASAANTNEEQTADEVAEDTATTQEPTAAPETNVQQGGKDAKKDNEVKDVKEFKDTKKDKKDVKDNKDNRNNRNFKENNKDSKGKDNKDIKDNKDNRDTKDSRDNKWQQINMGWKFYLSITK